MSSHSLLGTVFTLAGGKFFWNLSRGVSPMEECFCVLYFLMYSWKEAFASSREWIWPKSVTYSHCEWRDLHRRSIFYTTIRIKNLLRIFSLSEQKREGRLNRTIFPFLFG